VISGDGGRTVGLNKEVKVALESIIAELPVEMS